MGYPDKIPDDEEDPSVEEILSKALIAARDAFDKSMENWDMWIEYRFRASLRAQDDTGAILKTVCIDNIERGGKKVDEPL